GELGGALSLLADDARFAQHPEMVGHGRLGDRDLEGAAGTGRVVLGQLADDLEALRIAERMQDGRQLDLRSFGVMEVHAVDYTTAIELWYDARRTIETERRSSYAQDPVSGNHRSARHRRAGAEREPARRRDRGRVHTRSASRRRSRRVPFVVGVRR